MTGETKSLLEGSSHLSSVEPQVAKVYIDLHVDGGEQARVDVGKELRQIRLSRLSQPPARRRPADVCVYYCWSVIAVRVCQCV